MKSRLNTLIYVFMIALFCFSGCGSIQTVSPSHCRKKSYELKTSYVTVVGKPMLSIYNTDIFPAYKAKYTYQPPYIYIRGDKLCEQMPLITPEQKWRFLYRRAKGNYVIYSDNYNKLAGTEKTPLGIEITPAGKLADEEAWVHTHTPVQRAVQALWDVPKPQLFEKTEDYVKEAENPEIKSDAPVYTMDWDDEAKELANKAPEGMTEFIIENSETYAREKGYPKVSRSSISEQMEEMGMNLDDMLSEV